MTPFEYVIVLVSLILGLGITVVLTGLAGIIRHWNRASVYWPYLIWIVLVFIMHIHEWWIMYEWRDIQSWSLVTFLFVLLYPILLFVLANLMFPTRWRKKQMNMRLYYFRLYPKFFINALALIATAVASDLIIAGRSVQEQLLKAIVFVFILTVYLIKPKNTWAHGVLALFLLLATIGSLLILSDELIIR
ncbi:MAG: hypothetical protein L6Q51_08880 [Cyclobacteriaceae bacterium]|nr:hypothetical protein [Cyclobacteriaceae bacterium]